MTASKQKYSDIVAHMEAAQHELEKAKDIANALTGESYTTGVVTACLSLVSNFANVLGQMEMFLKDKKASKSEEEEKLHSYPSGFYSGVYGSGLVKHPTKRFDEVDDMPTQSEEETKDIRGGLLASLRGAFKMLCHPNKKNPYLHIAVRDGSDKIMTALDSTNGTLFQDTPNVTYFGTVNLGELKPGDADRLLAAYEDVINRYVDDLEAGETLDRPEGTEYKSDFNVYVVIDILRYLKERRDNSDTTIVTEDIVFNPDFAEKWGADSIRENWKQAIDAGLIQCWPERGSVGLEITKTTPLSITDAGIDFLNFAENGFLWNTVKYWAAKVSELSILLSKVAVVKERAEVHRKERAKVYGKEKDEAKEQDQ